MSAGYLLDTHVFLWLAADDPRLTDRARAIFADSTHPCFLSAASVWEMAIKASLGKLTLGTSLAQLVDGGVERGVRMLDVTRDHAYLVESMPFHHRDPFDRLLVAQAKHEGLVVVSADEQLDPYGPARVWQ